MRRFALLLMLAAICLTFLPRHLSAWGHDPYKEAEKLALQERYEEAVERMQQFDLPNDAYKWVQSKIGLCVTYSLWGKNAEALDACNQALRHRFFSETLKCYDKAVQERVRVMDAPGCHPSSVRYDLILYIKIWQTLDYWRSGEQLKSAEEMIRASYIFRDYGEDAYLFYAVVSYVTNDFSQFKKNYSHEGKDPAQIERLRIILTYGGASTPAARVARTARVLWIEQPYTKPTVYAFAAVLLCTAIYIPARRPLRRLALALLSAPRAARGPLKTLASGALLAGRSIPVHINVWLHPARPPAPPSPVATPGAAPSPAYAPAPAPMPIYFNYRYPNQAYRLAGYCFAAFWAVLLGPLVLALLMPAFTLLADFSTSGFQRAYNHFIQILTASLAWARLWFALLLFSLIGFIGFKLYGRFSLPKRMRPPIRVVYGTLRFAFLGAILTGVGTFLSYFTATFTGLYSNPLVKTLISLIRKIIGI